jgi:flagellar biosynthesis protein FliR
MEQLLAGLINHMDYFLLIFVRTTALIMASPIFGHRNVPATVKIAFCLVLSYVVFAGNPNGPTIVYTGLLDYAVMFIKELLFGMVLGYVTTLFFSIAQTAGYMMDMQMDFGMASAYDTMSNTNVPLTGNFLNIIMLITFFAVNGHQKLIFILNSTFTQIPVGHVALNASLGVTALEVFVLAFVLAVNVAIPLIVAGLLGEVALGILVRTIPQMNIFVVGIPLKILLGLTVLVLIIPIYVGFTDTLFNQMFTSIEKMLSGLVSTS